MKYSNIEAVHDSSARAVPVGVSERARQTGTYLVVLAFGSSLPLWIQSLWVEATPASSVAGQQERGGEDQVRRTSFERREHVARGVADDELGANQLPDDGLDLRGLVRVWFDGHDEGAGYVRNIHIVKTTATATNVHI